MWEAKLIIPVHKSQVLSPRTKKYHICVIGYPLSWEATKHGTWVVASGTLQGKNDDIVRFLADLKRNSCVDHLEYNDGFFLIRFKHDSLMASLYSPRVIHSKPIIVNSHGENIFHIASWKKEELLPFISIVKSEKYGGRLCWVKMIKTPHLSILSMIPALTDQQDKAFSLALRHGYYDYPRKITLKRLAQLMNISYATYQFHLRHGEKKIIPNLYKNSMYVDKN